jgi:uroporphyrinogen decarboxylase
VRDGALSVPTIQNSLLIRTVRGEAIERPPVWAMRQAGRWDPEFNRLRGGLSFYEFSENVELAARASLLPRRFGVDAIILFYDITTLTVAMGLPFSLQASQGPVPSAPMRTMADVERLKANPSPELFGHIRALLRRVRDELQGALPVIVFAGAPFTLATYCIGTGKDMDATSRFAAERPEVWQGLLERLEQATIHFLNVLIADGADLYQLFDSWAGRLPVHLYDEWAHRYHRCIFAAVQGAPGVLFVKECPYLSQMTSSGAAVVSLGISHDLAAASSAYPAIVFQGNVDEQILAHASPEQVAQATASCVRQGGGRRHIVNLSHGINRSTPVENFEAYVNTVRSATASS